MKIHYLLLIMASMLVWHCGGTDSDNQKATEDEQTSKLNEYGLTDFEMKYGIGPIQKRMFPGQINPALAKKGETIFQTKCSPCHKLDERYIGPAQRYATERRPPEYLLNMMINPDEMVKRHPEAKKLLAEYLSPMTFQNISQEDALNVLEYLRQMAKEGREKNIPEIPVFKSQIQKQN